MKLNSGCEFVTGGIGSRDIEGVGRNVGGMNFPFGQFRGQSKSNRSGAGADIGDAKVWRGRSRSLTVAARINAGTERGQYNITQYAQSFTR